MNSHRVLRWSFLQAVLALMLWCAPAHAQTAATVTQIAGMVVETDSAGHSRVLAMNSTVESGSVLRTAADSHARLKFGDGTDIVLRADTEFRVDRFRFEQAKPADDGFAVRLVKGGFRQVTGLLAKRNPQAMDIKAAMATIGIRGTDFAVRLCANDCTANRESDDKRTQDDARRQQDAQREQQAQDAQRNGAPGAGVYVQVYDGVVSLAQAGAEIVLVKGEVGFADVKNNPPGRVDSPPPVLLHDPLLGQASSARGCGP